ncbi:hypothetical protein CTheo_5591 [Ceratobasidium theobromae]|uniref:Nephrocystin 3-like N-terminal domain-containing protein n=1 Tax=Ceratobasidium theobromae TaxID=1582974 RepID=A0A5N5QGU7_9AGAM|nr:hypothetical protein CTheo_5591 [Ceratobasidium theobromae]
MDSEPELPVTAPALPRRRWYQDLSQKVKQKLVCHSGSNSPTPAPNSLTQSPSARSANPRGSSRLTPPSPRASLSRASAANLRPSTPPPVRSPSPGFRNAAWKALEVTLKGLQKSSELVPPLRPAIDGLIEFLTSFEAATRHRQDYDKMASDLDITLQFLNRYLEGSTSIQMTDIMTDIVRAVEEEIGTFGTQGHSSLRPGISAKYDEEDLVQRYRRIEQLFHRLQLEVSMGNWHATNATQTEARLNNLEPAKLSTYNSKLSVEINRRTCTENTRKAVLSGLDTWSGNPNAEKIFWMDGMAGTGKTTIACTFSGNLQLRGQLAASFFCTRTSPECRDANRIVPTIAYQLSRHSTPFRSVLGRALEKNPDVASLNITSQFEQLLKIPLFEVKDQLPNNLIVVIDALDECDDDRVVVQILDVLFRFSENLPIKFFVTSRPEPAIRERMLSPENVSRSILHLHEIERSMVQADIELYLHEELRFMSPSTTEVNELAALAGNLFIYAATVVRYIRPRKMSVDPRKRLEKVLSRSADSKSGFNPIDSLYSTILSAAIDDEELEQEDRELIKLVLWTAVCAREPITVETLATLGGVDDEVQALAALQPLRSVLHVSEETKLPTTTSPATNKPRHILRLLILGSFDRIVRHARETKNSEMLLLKVLHQAHDDRQAWIKERNKRIDSRASVAQRASAQPGPTLINREREGDREEEPELSQIQPTHSRSGNSTPTSPDASFVGPPPIQSPPSHRSLSPTPPLVPELDDARPGSPLRIIPNLPPAGTRNDLEIQYGEDEDESMYQAGYEATRDPPYIRLAYLSAMESSIIHHNSVAGVNSWLSAHITSLRLAGALPDHLNPLVTLGSVRSRLGLDTDPFMLQQPICSICYTPYSMKQVLTANDAQCTYRPGRKRCEGQIWTTKIANNAEKRCPTRQICYTRLVPALRRMFMRPSFIRALQAGRRAHERHKEGPTDTLYDICCGASMKSARIGMHRVFGADGSVRDEPESEGSERPLTNLEFGLALALNIDWFRSTPKGTESVGAVYLTIQNLERSVRFLPSNVILACLVPGPKEPPLEELNWVFQPIVDQIKLLYAGIAMKIHGEDRLVHVYTQLILNDADTPARCKSCGTAGHAHGTRFCRCNTEQGDINTAKGYDINNLVLTNEELLLCKAYESRCARTKAARNAIHKEFGIRWSALNELPDWRPYSSAPVDPMHNLFLGIVSHCWNDVLIAGIYFTAAQKRQFDRFLDNFEWPSGIGRLPKNLCEKGGVRKADEWRRLISILPLGLWAVWRDTATDTIPLGAPPIHDQTGDLPRFQRSYRLLYDLVVNLASACRIIASWAITHDDIKQAQWYLQEYCQGLLRMGIALKPNHHFCMHYQDFFLAFGPAYAWWLFSYERFNGLLEQVKINNKSDNTATSLMRFWIRLHRLHELVESLLSNITNEEKLTIAKLCYSQPGRGTLLAQAALPDSDNLDSDSESGVGNFQAIRTPQHSRIPTLQQVGNDIYLALLRFAQARWPDYHLKHDQNQEAGGTLFLLAQMVELLDFVYINGVRYGCTSSRRTLNDRHIVANFSDSQLHACRIEYLFRIHVKSEAPVLIAAVKCFVTSNNLPTMPWDLRCVILLRFAKGFASALEDHSPQKKKHPGSNLHDSRPIHIQFTP